MQPPLPIHSFTLRDATRQDVEVVATGPLRQLDAQEWLAGSGIDPVKAFRFSCVHPDTKHLRALTYEGRTVAIWGVSATETPGLGSLWLMAVQFHAPATMKSVAFFNLWKEEIVRLHEGFERLVALADMRNKEHHRWLKTMGFEAMPDVVLGEDGSPFTCYLRRHT